MRGYADDGTPKRVGITMGPEYGTVGPSSIKDAAREANKASEIDQRGLRLPLLGPGRPARAQCHHAPRRRRAGQRERRDVLVSTTATPPPSL
ncbi:MAG: hypothetical protein M3Q48_16540 [Actinomycetota bacterium]|nr:hypothetical protein [Actinomycetota bacterium]